MFGKLHTILPETNIIFGIDGDMGSTEDNSHIDPTPDLCKNDISLLQSIGHMGSTEDNSHIVIINAVCQDYVWPIQSDHEIMPHLIRHCV